MILKYFDQNNINKKKETNLLQNINNTIIEKVEYHAWAMICVFTCSYSVLTIVYFSELNDPMTMISDDCYKDFIQWRNLQPLTQDWGMLI